jgi:pyruvate/2-oxoglutarate/acetoin dehydrogenase E1 component
MPRQTVASALRAAFAAAFRDDDRLIVVGEGAGRTGGLDGLFSAIDPERRFETPIADRAAVGLAIGLALAGRRPIVELTASGRVHATLEPLAEAAAFAAAGEQTLDLAVRVPVGGQAGPLIDRSATDALLALPGVSVLAPSTPDDVVTLWRHALGSRGVTVVLEPRALLSERCDGGGAPTADPRARVARPGQHVTLVAWASGVEPALRAAQALAADGIDAEVLDLRALRPLDTAAIARSVQRTGRAVFVAPPEGGFVDRASLAAVDGAFLYLESPLSSAPATPEAIARAARDAVAY